MKNKIALIVLSDSLSPEEINRNLGVTADETWKSGSVRKNTTIIEKENGWIINSKLSGEADFEEHVKNIKELIEGFEDRFKNLSRDANNTIQLSCISYFDEEPAINLEAFIIDWMSNIGASLDIDLYCSR